MRIRCALHTPFLCNPSEACTGLEIRDSIDRYKCTGCFLTLRNAYETCASLRMTCAFTEMCRWLVYFPDMGKGSACSLECVGGLYFSRNVRSPVRFYKCVGSVRLIKDMRTKLAHFSKCIGILRITSTASEAWVLLQMRRKLGRFFKCIRVQHTPFKCVGSLRTPSNAQEGFKILQMLRKLSCGKTAAAETITWFGRDFFLNL